MRAACIILQLILLQCYTAEAYDQHLIDSLNTVIETANHDTAVCRAYLILGEEVYMSNPDTALILWQQALEMAERNLTSHLPTSLNREYQSYLVDALNNIGYIYMNHGDIPKALQYFHRCLKMDEEAGNKVGVATSLNNLGFIYKKQGDTARALEFYQKSLELEEGIGNMKGIAASLNNIGRLYDDQGATLKALQYYQKSLKIEEEMGHGPGIAYCLNNIGLVYNDQGDIAKALEYHYMSLRMYKEAKDKAGMASCLNNIGVIELGQGAWAQALEKGTQGLLIAREIGSPQLISYHSDLLSEIAKEQGNYEEALTMYELHIHMRDSIRNEETQKATIRQQTKYEFEKAQLVKEQEEKEAIRLLAEETSRRDNLQYSVILIAILILFGGVLALGFINVSERMAEGIIFFSFLILFEFFLVLADPYIDNWSGGAPGVKLLFNAGIAALIFPLHSLFETKLKKRLAR